MLNLQVLQGAETPCTTRSMHQIRRMCVFCASSPGGHPEYRDAAVEAGHLLAERRITLVYGGGKVGLMGNIADAVLGAGGQVIGVIPQHLEAREVAHRGLSELRVVGTMHERKALMADLADAFMGLPGGLGTIEEFFEVATWTQLGIHAKPLGLLNVRGYYDLIDQFLGKAVDERFLRPEHRSLISISDRPRTLLEMLQSFTPTHIDKWLDRSER
jgi:uncharacterized protein (TIGR00730 family)